MNRVSRLIQLPLGLLLVLGLAACGSDPTGLGGTNFEPQQTAQATNTIKTQLNSDDDVIASLELVGPALDSAGVTSFVLPRNLANPREVIEGASAHVVQNFVLSGSSSDPIFPSNLLGKTFEWSDEFLRYVLNESLTGAPANGVRFLLYPIDPVTRQPVSPAAGTDIGYLDLTDEGSASSTRLGLVAVTSGVTRIDYYIDVSFTATENDISVTLAGVGFVSDGTAAVDFNLSESVAFDLLGESVSLDLLFSVAVPAEDVSVTLDMTIDVTGQEQLETASVVLTISDGDDTVVLDATLATDDSLDGTISYNGTVVVNVTGTGENPVFTMADGTELTADDIGALHDLVNLFDDLFDFAEHIFDPFDDSASF
ncbi:MAG: hypothetical protein V3U67_01250 [Gemmatimonadota bacterium]